MSAILLSPYDILDLSPESSNNQIKSRYRQLVLLYHPDKRRRNSNIVTREYFEQIQKAYKDLMRIRRDKYMPNEMIDYRNDESEFQQHLDDEIRNILDLDEVNDNDFTIDLNGAEDEDIKEFNDNFNERFEKVNELFKDINIQDNKGYKEFGNRKITNEVIQNQEYQTIKINTTHKPQNNYNKQKSNIPQENHCNSFRNLGMIKHNNLSISTFGKDPLSSSDIQQAFGNENQGFFNIEKESSKKEYKTDTEKLLQERIAQRNNDIIINQKTKQELEIMWQQKETELKTLKANQDLQYQRDKSQFNSIWEKTIKAKKKLLEYS